MLNPKLIQRLQKSVVLLSFASIWYFLFFAAPGNVSAAPQETIHQVYITNVRDTTFTVSWTTDELSNGSVDWGTTNGLGNTTSDAVTNISTHYVVISGLLPETTYYFQVRSGTTIDDNGGAYYILTTGPSLGGAPRNFLYWGYLYLPDGVTPLPNAIIYLQIHDANGSDSPGDSQWLSARTEAGGAPGVWSFNLNNARIADASSYFTFSSNDQVRIIWQGGTNGCIGESPSDIRLFLIPSSQPVRIDMTLDNNPTAVTLKSFASHPSSYLPSLVLFLAIALLGSILGAVIIWRQRTQG